ncbi:UvrD-helicase domain-containing protein [Cellulomonas sp. zg-ZUI199]|uniref:RecBCD enzyme subunit RecB n=1 Tax=Cellulomonas wangleii TaxID=2816956 RepID=A0ABX8D2L8_9CELL|nr:MULTISPECIES: UvrD-helicase domain-containing protein [Cellulomonas]MBO0902007.1 UvrD-helicase domain-containing protein [Cellulomonas sp. zg-ZUI22]MBO0925229.1 UvrD-helicase domain-containing protein [Cellulomonas wangleii]QVI61263.1 UvrD-helicase domain-containing protein [Cellulomonas wangleii]
MTATTGLDVFDVRGPLPSGTTVLEASAGTGKTFTIAALTARYVAEGHARLPELLLVTFGRMATSELRDRVRARLVATERALREPGARASDDVLVRHLADVDDAELARRRDRLTVALSEVDAATITTTHGFCQQMLRTLGTATGGGHVEPGAALLPDVADLEAQVVDDLYLGAYAFAERPVLSVPEAREVARAAVSDHAAVLAPDDAPPGTPPDHRYRLARAVRREMVRRRRAAHVVDYDDLLTLLHAALTDPVSGAAAAERVRAPYRVVMVDEFQDTDEVQWEILRAAFHGHRTLVLIGDPKQAIYAFRGADVHTYLAARAVATTSTLGRSWRADAPVLDGLAHLLGGAALGDPRIVVHPVQAARQGRRLEGGPPVVVRRVTRRAVGAGSAAPRVDAVRSLIHRDVAAQVVRTLRDSRLRDGDAWRPVLPGDVAVLARRNADALAVRDALVAAGVPAVVSGLSSVFATSAARDWLVLLSALAATGDAARVAAAALTPFVGWDAARLAGAADRERDDLADLLRGWSHVLAGQGVAALLQAAAASGLHERLAARVDGERALTDVRHVGEVLHAAARDAGLGAAALTEWLRARIGEAAGDYAEERSRRLETDAAAVQVVTVHAAKGLEFPVVMVPFAWDRFVPRTPAVLRYHDEDGTRRLHVGGPGSPGYEAARARHQAEEAGEDLRLAYVALTRASSQVVVWWAPSTVSASGAVGRLVLGARDALGLPPDTVPVPRDDQAAAAFEALADRSGGTVAHETVDEAPAPVRWAPERGPLAPLDVAHLHRTVDTTWRRTSYSGLTAAAHDAGPAGPGAPDRVGVADEPEDPGIQDESDGPVPVRAPRAGDTEGPDPEALGRSTPEPALTAALRAVRSPLADLPGGTAFGTLVHHVLEHVDTAADDLAAELRARCVEAAGYVAGLGIDPGVLAGALLPALHTPGGPLLGGRTLAQVAPRDRLAELDLELPLAGGDLDASGRHPATLADVATLLRAHLPADDPFAPYAGRLQALHDDTATRPGALRGYLTGSIDAVLRVEVDGDTRYVVVDYKTNRLGPPDEPLTAWHYRPAATTLAMMDAHYPLQLLLYTVGLHRFLRWRLPGYDPDRHLGGGAYLFVRGMCGPATPVVDGSPCGVVSWRPPSALVVALSALLDGRGTGR